MHLTSETGSDGVVQRRFVVDGVPGVLWLPASSEPSEPSEPSDGPERSEPGGRPLVLLGHGGGQHKTAPGVVERARRCVTRYGYAAVALDAPGHGERNRSAQDERFATEIGELLAAGRPISAWVARHTAALAERAVPEWRAVLDALGAIGEGLGPVGYWGLSLGSVVGIPLAAAEPRITAAVFGLTGLTGQTSPTEAAGRVGVPLRFLLQWDDELVPREAALALFGALGSREKTLHANPGGHEAVPDFELASSERFLCRRLRPGAGA